MSIIRSLLFAVFLLIFTPLYTIVCLSTFPFPALTRYRIITVWAKVVMWFCHHLLGIRYRVIGHENLPAEGTAVVLSKHQSAWETIAFQKIFPPLCFVLKRELLYIPFFGWSLALVPNIAINRKAAQNALAQVLEQGKDRLKRGFWVVVFPEGTRVAPGEHRRFKSGGAFLAKNAGVPAVPVAHNAGEFWQRNAFVKHPGEVIVSIGPPIDTHAMSATEINAKAEQWIESEMQRLFPHLYDASEK